MSVYQSLATVEGIRKGRSQLRESKPVRPVALDHVRATLPFLPAPIAAMVKVQLLTGMRPQEVCRLKPSEIDTSGSVWHFTPEKHKTEHHDIARRISIDAKAQEVLKPFLPTDPNEPCFTPAKTNATVIAERSAARKTPRYPSHMKRNAKKRKGRRDSEATYCTSSYRQCIERGIARANRSGATIPNWKPNQLRHTFATLARKLGSLDEVQAALGHTKANTTQLYAELATEKADDITTRTAAQISEAIG